MADTMDFAGKTLFVTAGASGMGRCFAEHVAKAGGNVVIADIDDAAAEALAASLPRTIAVTCDVGDPEQVEAARDRAVAAFGRVDIVMSHAGITVAGPITAIDDRAWTRILDLNVIGMARVLRAFVPQLIAQQTGHVILTSSSLALIGGHPLSGMAAPYVASKAAVIGLAQAAAVGLAPHGIGVTLFAPDLTDTSFAKPPPGAPPAPPGVVSGLVPPARQTPEQAIESLLSALKNSQFLASATPDHTDLLRRQADALLDPLALSDLYSTGGAAIPKDQR